ncbi:MAG: hypothetical protein V2I56_11035 [Desulfobacteraceae bacterium]|jgi:hypothetical protein|nr:hypothetical protein [Desulfobacteraceae bacterium]
MGTDTDTKSSNPSEIQPLAEFDPGKEPAAELDQRDVIEPLKKTEDEAGDQQPENESDTPEDGGDNKQEILLDGAVSEGETKDDNPGGGGESPEEEPAEDSQKQLPKSAAKNQKAKPPVKNTASSQKIFLSTLILFMVAGAAIYSRPALFGLKGMQEGAFAAKTEIKEPVKQTEIQVQQPEPLTQNKLYLSTIGEIDRLREELLAKKEEIFRLKLHYRNGIGELKDQIGLEMSDANISSFAQAMQNKRIELNLRTIQRRQVYIQELEKPNQWVHNGSEELLFLKRKALLDFELTDIASGIDLDRHMRYMTAAIQKYQPSADKLAVDPPPAEITPLETIWSQILHQQLENVPAPIGQENEEIIDEICSENFRRIAELSAITPQAAMCLARMKGSDLFLNKLKQLTAQDAKYLFQWQGNWICLNSVKTLSPAVAKYLFKWEGNWISLNGLTEFPPELALYLMEWKGNQLELMGLHYDKVKTEGRILKYLALWETMGGKLFVSDDIRNEMERMM